MISLLLSYLMAYVLTMEMSVASSGKQVAVIGADPRGVHSRQTELGISTGQPLFMSMLLVEAAQSVSAMI